MAMNANDRNVLTKSYFHDVKNCFLHTMMNTFILRIASPTDWRTDQQKDRLLTYLPSDNIFTFKILFLYSSFFYKSISDRQTDCRADGRTDRRTDTHSYRDARTHLKTMKNDEKMNKKEIWDDPSWPVTYFLWSSIMSPCVCFLDPHVDVFFSLNSPEKSCPELRVKAKMREVSCWQSMDQRETASMSLR